MGRPKKPIDEDNVRQLASYGLTNTEIAAYFKVHRDTISDRFSAIIKDGHERRNASLRRKQFVMAMKGSVPLLIWLGKQYLGQTEKVEQSGEVTLKEAIDRGKQFIGRVNGRVIERVEGNGSGTTH